jgi:hypothetical protein
VATRRSRLDVRPLTRVVRLLRNESLNMLTVKYANAFRDVPYLSHVKINAVTPRYVATDLNVFRGVRSADEGARASVYWATVGDDCATGGFRV